MSVNEYINLIGTQAVGEEDQATREIGEHKLIVDSGVWIPNYPKETNLVWLVAKYGDRFFRVAERGIDFDISEERIREMRKGLDFKLSEPKFSDPEEHRSFHKNRSAIALYVGSAVRKISQLGIQAQVAQREGDKEECKSLMSKVGELVVEWDLINSELGHFVQTREERAGIGFKVNPKDELITEMISEVPKALIPGAQAVNSRMSKAMAAEKCILATKEIAHKVIDTHLKFAADQVKPVIDGFIDAAAKRVLIRGSDPAYEIVQRRLMTMEGMVDDLNISQADGFLRGVMQDRTDKGTAMLKTIGEYVSLVADIRFELPKTFDALKADVTRMVSEATASLPPDYHDH